MPPMATLMQSHSPRGSWIRWFPCDLYEGVPGLLIKSNLFPSDTVLKCLIISGLPVQVGNPGWTLSYANMWNHVLASMQKGPNTALLLTSYHIVTVLSEDLFRWLIAAW